MSEIMFTGTPMNRVTLGDGMPTFTGFQIVFGNQKVEFEDMKQSLDFKIEGSFDTQYFKDLGIEMHLDLVNQVLYVTGELIGVVNSNGFRSYYYIFSKKEKEKLLKKIILRILQPISSDLNRMINNHIYRLSANVEHFGVPSDGGNNSFYVQDTEDNIRKWLNILRENKNIPFMDEFISKMEDQFYSILSL